MPILRPIPSIGERVPAVGMGTWVTFNVGDDTRLLGERLEVLRTFFDMGGTVVDSSPMYGTAEAAVGLAIIISIFRHYETVNVDQFNLLKW